MACQVPLSLSYEACCTTPESPVQQMKALSIKQPFAGLLAFGNKTIETRTWKTNFRGPVVICAGKNIHTGRMIDPDTKRETSALHYWDRNKMILPVGNALAVADLIDCRPMTKDDEAAACCSLYPGAFAWVFSNPRLIYPFPVKGQLSLFNITEKDVKYRIDFW